MAEPAERRHDADGEAALQRRAAARQLAVVMRGFGEAHRDAGADRGRQADQEGLPGVLRGEGGGEDRRQRRHRAVHQAGQPRLHIGQDELPPLGLRLLPAARPAGACLQSEPAGQRLVRLLGGGEIAEQLARLGVARALRRLDVEAVRVGLHLLRLRAHLVDAERPAPASPACARSSRAHARAGSAGCARRSAPVPLDQPRRGGRPPPPPSRRTLCADCGNCSRSPSA